MTEGREGNAPAEAATGAEPNGGRGAGRPTPLLSRTLSYMFRYWPTILVAFLVTVVVSSLSIARPWIQKLLIDNVTLGGSTRELAKVIGLLLGVAVMQVVRAETEDRPGAALPEKPSHRHYRRVHIRPRPGA